MTAPNYRTDDLPAGSGPFVAGAGVTARPRDSALQTTKTEQLF